jgi:hypothetical protein
MGKIVKCSFCCCRGCKRGFDRLNEFLGHLSSDGYCRGTAGRVVRDVCWLVLYYGVLIR